MRSGPVEGAPDRAAGADNFAFRKRLDGGYTIARRNANVAPLTPDSFRLFFDFLPALVTQWHELRLRSAGASWRSGASRGAGRSMPSHRSRRCARSTPRLRAPFSMRGKGT